MELVLANLNTLLSSLVHMEPNITNLTTLLQVAPDPASPHPVFLRC